jgi:hypothetical protein
MGRRVSGAVWSGYLMDGGRVSGKHFSNLNVRQEIVTEPGTLGSTFDLGFSIELTEEWEVVR